MGAHERISETATAFMSFLENYCSHVRYWGKFASTSRAKPHEENGFQGAILAFCSSLLVGLIL